MIKYLVIIDEEIRSALSLLEAAADVEFWPDETQRIFDDCAEDRRSEKRYVLHRSPELSVTGLVEESDPKSIWLTVNGPPQIEAGCDRVLCGLRVLATVTGEDARRWLRFSLRRLFALVLLFAIPLSWSCVQLKWIRDRHEALTKLKHSDSNISLSSWFRPQPLPPLSIMIFGEKSVAWIMLPPRDATQYTVEEVQMLFPEAQVHQQQFEGDNTGWVFFR